MLRMISRAEFDAHFKKAGIPATAEAYNLTCRLIAFLNDEFKRYPGMPEKSIAMFYFRYLFRGSDGKRIEREKRRRIYGR